MLKILTVNEDGGQSDRITAKYKGYDWATGRQDVYISVSSKNMFSISDERTSILLSNFCKKDLRDLIEFMEDAYTFLDEEDTIAKLIG